MPLMKSSRLFIIRSVGSSSKISDLQAFMKTWSGVESIFGTLLKGLSLKLSHKPAEFKSFETFPVLRNVTSSSLASLSFSKITDTRALFSPLLTELTVPLIGDLT